MTGRVTAWVSTRVAFHATTGLPGGTAEIALPHYAMDGLLLDMLTTSSTPACPPTTC